MHALSSNPESETTGSDASASTLIARHQGDVWRYLRHLGCEHATADDLTQETFLTLLQTPFVDRSERRTAAWLRQVAENQFRNWLRARRRREDPDWIAAVNAVWNVPQPATSRRQEALATCIERLDGRSREIVERFYGAGASRRAVATALGIQEAGIKTRLQRLRAALRECVARVLSQQENR